jgi:hypothetical protein
VEDLLWGSALSFGAIGVGIVGAGVAAVGVGFAGVFQHVGGTAAKVRKQMEEMTSLLNVAVFGKQAGITTQVRFPGFIAGTTKASKWGTQIIVPGVYLARPRITGVVGTVIGGDSTVLRGRLLSQQGVIDNFGGKFQAHHLIPSGVRDLPILRQIGFDLDDASNGIMLPRDLHLSNHPEYSAAVSTILRGVNSVQPVDELITAVYAIQAKPQPRFPVTPSHSPDLAQLTTSGSVC